MSEAGDTDRKVVLEPVKRVELFGRLLEGPASRSELQDVLDVSRATLHRVVTFLVDEEFAVEADGALELTPMGREVATAATTYVEHVEAVKRLEPLLAGVDTAALPVELDLDLLTDAEVVRPKPGQPQQPARRLVELVEEADSVRGLGPVVLPIYVEVFHREILDGTPVELVLEPDVVDGLDDSYTDQFEEALATGRLDVAIHESLPLGLVVTPRTVGILGYDEEDILRILVESDGDEVRAWADELYDQYRSMATTL